VALAAEVGRYVHKLADADAFAGVVLLARGDRPFFVTAVGQASREYGVPNRPDTRFNLGSITKTFTAVAVLQLAERGKLSLDDPLSKYLPDVPDPESARRITLRQLLTHTSGLGDHVNAMARDPFRTRYRTVGRMLELVRGVPPMFEPGTRWRYSNSGFLVLGAVIEKAAGQDYYEYVRENVFTRAGMADTDFCELDEVNGRLATGYTKAFHAGRPRVRNNQFDLFVRGGPEGGAYSTAHDLLRFARALRAGRLVGARLVAEALSAKPSLGSPGYGYGFEVEEGGRIVGHGGSYVGAQTKLDLYRDGDYTAVVLSNMSGAARPVVAKVRNLLLAERPCPK
jgi:CubicO group peptidase (beta-lactamase class C family)